MRNVAIQDEEDKMIKALREVFGIKEKTPEMVAEEALQKSVIKGRSYPLYTDEELTQQERRARAINTNDSLRRLAGVSGLFDDEDRDLPTLALDPTFVNKYMDYMKSLEEFKEKNFRETSKPEGYKYDPYFEIKSKAGRPPDIEKKSQKATERERKIEKERELQAQQFFESFRKRDTEGVAKKGRTFENPEEASIAIQSAIRNKRARDIAINEKKSKENQRQFQSDLERLIKQREQETEKINKMNKDIQKSFNLYEASQKAKKGGEMSSLLFD